jgi:hypothetical protein
VNAPEQLARIGRGFDRDAPLLVGVVVVSGFEDQFERATRNRERGRIERPVANLAIVRIDGARELLDGSV